MFTAVRYFSLTAVFYYGNQNHLYIWGIIMALYILTAELAKKYSIKR
jgi:hypothetical protein